MRCSSSLLLGPVFQPSPFLKKRNTQPQPDTHPHPHPALTTAMGRVRRAGYDSIFIPRMVSVLDADKLDKFCTKIRNMTAAQASSETIESSLRQILLTLAKETSTSTSTSSSGGEAGSGVGGEAKRPAGGHDMAGKCYRQGGATMGCRCWACTDDIAEASRQLRHWEQEHLPVRVLRKSPDTSKGALKKSPTYSRMPPGAFAGLGWLRTGEPREPREPREEEEGSSPRK